MSEISGDDFVDQLLHEEHLKVFDAPPLLLQLIATNCTSHVHKITCLGSMRSCNLFRIEVRKLRLSYIPLTSARYLVVCRYTKNDYTK